MIAGFDIISDLNLTSQDTFDWEGKPTSLFCVIPGNISDDVTVLYKTFKNLSKYYQGVFFIDGSVENPDVNLKDARIQDISKLCDSIPNVVYLHTNVVVVDGVALVGVNGWEDSKVINSSIDTFQAKVNKYDDLLYLERTVGRLQLHVDVKKIMIISNAIPAKELHFGSLPEFHDDMFLTNILDADTEGKIAKWVYGTSDKMVDTVINGVKFVNNPKFDKNPYYPKRIEIEV